jgi:pimeloyl-ACP methyl ester carboxylesterase
MERTSIEQLEVAYEVHGTPGERASIILLHGFPDDATAWRDVGGHIAAIGRHALAPYVRGCGPTRFRAGETPRSGQVSACARDVVELMDALQLERVVLMGQDWGASTAQAVTMLYPERVERLIVLNGHGLFNLAVFAQGKRPSWRTFQAGWYQWLFQTPIGAPLLREHRASLARYLWQEWSPGWRFAEDELDAAVRSFDNPDWAEVVLSAHRPWTDDPCADPKDEEASQKLAAAPAITRPTLNLQGARDGVDLFEDTQLGQEAFYRGGFRREQIRDCGHFLHRERPDAVAKQLARFLDEG